MNNERARYLHPRSQDFPRARQLARRNGLSTSAFVENLIRQVDRSVVQETPAKTFSQEWRGKMKLIRDRRDPRARRLFEKYGDENCVY